MRYYALVLLLVATAQMLWLGPSLSGWAMFAVLWAAFLVGVAVLPRNEREEVEVRAAYQTLIDLLVRLFR